MESCKRADCCRIIILVTDLSVPTHRHCNFGEWNCACGYLGVHTQEYLNDDGSNYDGRTKRPTHTNPITVRVSGSWRTRETSFMLSTDNIPELGSVARLRAQMCRVRDRLILEITITMPSKNPTMIDSNGKPGIGGGVGVSEGPVVLAQV
jgi:hypothetical protein